MKTRQHQSLKNKWTHNDANMAGRSTANSSSSSSGDTSSAGEDKSSKTKKKGKLTERLISQGLLTPQMIEELKREIEHRDT